MIKLFYTVGRCAWCGRWEVLKMGTYCSGECKRAAMNG